MVRSPKSQGRGNRRWPGRPGGARKKRAVGRWQARAQRMVKSIDEIAPPVISIPYQGVFRQTAEHNIYLFDQKMAARDISYFAEFIGQSIHTTFFTISVSEDDYEAVAEVAERLSTQGRK